MLRALREVLELSLERRAAVEGGVVERLLDLRERQPELTTDQHLLQAQEVILRVEAVARSGARHGYEQPKLVVVMQGAHGNAGDASHLVHPITARRVHHPILGPHAT